MPTDEVLCVGELLWDALPDDVLQKAGDLSGKVIVSCSLPMNAEDTDLVIAHTSSGAEELAKKIPKARVVSAFNTVPSEVLFSVFEGAGGGEDLMGEAHHRIVA